MTELNPIIHAPVRLRLCSILAAVDAAEFSTLREHLDVADSVLSKHVSTLVDAGYATSKKDAIDGRRTTWIALSRSGRRALRAHIEALQDLIDAAEPADVAPPD